MKNRRASALVYVIIVVFSITSVVLIGARLASASNQTFNTQYDQARFKSYADGVVSEAISDCYNRSILLGNRTTTYDGMSITTTVTRNASNTKCYDLTVTATVNGIPYRVVKTIGDRATPSPVNYGIWIKKDYADSLLATSVNGSVYFGANATFLGAWTISDDLLIKGTPTFTSTPDAAGHSLSGVRDQPFTGPSKPDFINAETSDIGANSKGSITFGGTSGSGKYDTIYRDNNFTLSGGTFSGKGTIYVGGNLNINGNYNYADANSRTLIVVDGDMTVNLLATQLVGSYYVKGRITLSPLTLNVTRGNLCASDKLNRALCALTVTQDRSFFDTPAEGTKHRCPGF